MSFAKDVLQTLVTPMPKRFKFALLDSILSDHDVSKEAGRKIVNHIASDLGITGLRFSGKQGDVIFSPTDAVISVIYSSSKEWSRETYESFISFFDERGGFGTYLDIGANVGLTIIPLATKLRSVSCHAFEPEPSNARNLRSNIAANCPVADVTIHECALFSRDTELEFEISQSNHGDHRVRSATASISLENEAARTIIRVPAKPLDSFHLKGEGRPLAAKIDVQGGEPFVFAGGRDTLGAADMILFEWSPYMMRRMDADHAIVLSVVADGFARASILSPEGKPVFQGSAQDACAVLDTFFIENEKNPSQHVDVRVSR